MNNTEGFVLIGGKSTRMGRDKSRLKISDEHFVSRAARVLRTVASRVRVVGGEPDRVQEWEVVQDIYRDWGAFGGVHAALAAADSEWVVVLACDLPFVTADLLKRLATFRDDYEAVAPIQADQVPQPLCSFYRVNPCLERATELIEGKERRPISLLQSVRTRWVKFAEVEDLTGSSHFFDNINTPDDYTRAVAEGEQSYQS